MWSFLLCMAMEAGKGIVTKTPLTGKSGPQWELKVVWPWSKFDGPAWIDREEGDRPPGPGIYRCLVERGNLKEGKDAGRDWNYQWRIIEFNIAAQTTTPADTPTNGASEYRDPTRDSIEKQTCLKAAVEIAVAEIATGKVTYSRGIVLEDAQRFYDWLSGAPERATAPLEPPKEAIEGTQSTEQQSLALLNRHRMEEGWTFADVRRFLGGLEPRAWIKANPGKNFWDALQLCIQQAEFEKLNQPEEAQP
jgi:hypothetical protein